MPNAANARTNLEIIEGLVKPVAVFRFSDTEGPGHFATFLDANRIPWRLIKLDQGDPVPPSSEPYAGLAFMGGPMSANDELPWTQPVLSLMREAINDSHGVARAMLEAQFSRRQAFERWDHVLATIDAKADR